MALLGIYVLLTHGIYAAHAASIADIDHVVLFMQENRAFDHYLGTMAGVRGFNDANLQLNNGVPVWRQLTSPKLTNDSGFVSPWYLNYLGGNWSDATQCMLAGSNGWFENHAAWNKGANNRWAVDNTPWSLGFYKRCDVPVQWALADGWVVADMYQESVVASTSPNRVTWISGSINVPGSPQRSDQGGNPYIDNNETPGCEKGAINCYPLKWKTAAELYQRAGVSWQVYQDADNFDDNPFAWFKQFQDARRGSSLHGRGVKGLSLDTFYQQAANGSLPEISYIVGPTELSEHTPYSPHDGAWLQRNIASAIIKSPKYANTVLIISYDETGGWFDHVDPFRAPEGTPGEWLDDPYNKVGRTFSGPGFRVPMYIISPWTRRGGVYTEHADHNSQLLFIERWQASKGRNVTTLEMGPWRREKMGDLVAAFDFSTPDYGLPALPDASEPHKDARGVYDGSAHCMALFDATRPPVPYKGEGVIHDMASQVERGFKPIRGRLTQGRFLVLETGSHALTAPPGTKRATLTASTEQHDCPRQRWIAHAKKRGGDEFTLSSAVDGRFLCREAELCREEARALIVVVDFLPGEGYALGVGGVYLGVVEGALGFVRREQRWSMFSVSY
ncbi:extracellular phospholipase C [Ophiocordyceps camponoti-floridani]|uniref:Extracellular phospholipase C n=1 Tax=Ophiocordyceps camponoti-floridani TaxID=2030778 RepID=A0A8H4Q7F1_9HYPO|nr:extracellular phospholipase C [Ophiocordyceps camponoti-floridani]